MNVNSHTFEEAFAIVRSLLPTATFASVDLEFTGLGEVRPSQLDTPADRYDRARLDAETFPPIQFGLCIFRPCKEDEEEETAPAQIDEDAQEVVDDSSEGEHAEPKAEARPPRPIAWEAVPFNFNLCPKALYYPETERFPLFDRKFSVQSSSVEFLLKNGFNFQQSFKAGSTWLREDKERFVREKVASAILAKENRSGISKPDLTANDMKPVRRFRSKIQDWLNGLSRETHVDDEGNYTPPTISVPLPKGPMYRKLAFDSVRDLCPRLVYTSQKIQGIAMVLVKRMETEQDADNVMNQAKLEARQKKLDLVVSQAVGFRYLIDALSESHIPIVTHNGFLDLTKVAANFVAQLPEDINDFKRMLHLAFPNLIDTRLLQDRLIESNNELREMLQAARARDLSEVMAVFADGESKGKIPPAGVGVWIPEGRLAYCGAHVGSSTWVDGHLGYLRDRDTDYERDLRGFGRYEEDDSGRGHHEAGYDAQETGKLLLSMLSVMKGATWTSDDIGSEGFGECKFMKWAKNKIFLGSCGGYQHMDLEVVGRDDWNLLLEQGRSVVCDGLWDGEAGTKVPKNKYERFRRTLKKVTEGTRFDGEKSKITTVRGDSFLAVLTDYEKEEKGSGSKRASHGRKVRRSGKGTNAAGKTGVIDERIAIEKPLQPAEENSKRGGGEAPEAAAVNVGSDVKALSGANVHQGEETRVADVMVIDDKLDAGKADGEGKDGSALAAEQKVDAKERGREAGASKDSCDLGLEQSTEAGARGGEEVMGQEEGEVVEAGIQKEEKENVHRHDLEGPNGGEDAARAGKSIADDGLGEDAAPIGRVIADDGVGTEATAGVVSKTTVARAQIGSVSVTDDRVRGVKRITADKEGGNNDGAEMVRELEKVMEAGRGIGISIKRYADCLRSVQPSAKKRRYM